MNGNRECAIPSHLKHGDNTTVSPTNVMEAPCAVQSSNTEVEWVRNPNDGEPLVDPRTMQPISVAHLLATKPLRQELSTRPGPGNKKLTYLSGDSVTRTLNDIFGFDGWCLDVKSQNREECVKDEKGRYCVAYTAVVRLTHRRSGAYKEDIGAGDAIDKSLATAVSNAVKASVTDAMKRAARHFGDKLGNSLYQGTFSLNKAPGSLKDALDIYTIERAKSKFGFEKDIKKLASTSAPNPSSAPLAKAEVAPIQPVQQPTRFSPPSTTNNAGSKVPVVGNSQPHPHIQSCHLSSIEAAHTLPSKNPLQQSEDLHRPIHVATCTSKTPGDPHNPQQQYPPTPVAVPIHPDSLSNNLCQPPNATITYSTGGVSRFQRSSPDTETNLTGSTARHTTTQAPLTSQQRLQKSQLLDLSCFAAGSIEKSTNNSARPSTSTGLPSSLGGSKRSRDYSPEESAVVPSKRPNYGNNPYISS